MTVTPRRLVPLALVTALVATACSGGAAEPLATLPGGPVTLPPSGATGSTAAFGLPVVDPLAIPAGDVAIAGSSTVFPLSSAVLTRWIDEGGPEYTIESIGSGGGFERFCEQGASDIANASRPIKEGEVESCAAIGRQPIEIRVGTDALSVVIGTGNYFASTLTLDELARLFAARPGDTWDIVNPAFPAHPIALYSPGADSGTFDYFNEAVFDEADPSPILAGGLAEIIGEDDNLVVRGVAGDGCTEGDLSSTCAAGFFGYAYYLENAAELQVVAIDGILPDDATVNAGEYPLARPLYMYTDAGVIAARPQVGFFVAYYLTVVNEVIGDVGYFPAPADALQAAADAIAAAAGW